MHNYLAKDVGGGGGYSEEFPPQLSALRIGRDIDDIDGDDDEGGYRGPPGDASWRTPVMRCHCNPRDVT